MKRIYQISNTYFLLLIPLLTVVANISFAQSNTDGKNTALAIQDFAIVEEPQDNLDYMINTWSSPVTREEVKDYTSIMDFWSGDYLTKYKRDSFREIWVVNLKDYPDWQLDVDKIDSKYKAKSPTLEFTEEQLAVIENADFSDHLRFSAIFNRTTIASGKYEEDILISQSMSLVPDVQATYKGGFEELVKYLKKASKDKVRHVKREDVGRCRIFFTVSDKGTIKDVKLIESSYYPDVDEAMINIVKEMPKYWNPALTENGEKVDQEFVFTFGLAGC